VTSERRKKPFQLARRHGWELRLRTEFKNEQAELVPTALPGALSISSSTAVPGDVAGNLAVLTIHEQSKNIGQSAAPAPDASRRNLRNSAAIGTKLTSAICPMSALRAKSAGEAAFDS
jgi:hypothetical protein